MQRYVNGNTVPRSVGKGRFLYHNHIRHAVNSPCGLLGFRGWTDSVLDEDFEPCRCGWAGLPHYSFVPDQPCLPVDAETLDAMTDEEVDQLAASTAQ
jgi:hypothetical protein